METSVKIEAAEMEQDGLAEAHATSKATSAFLDSLYV